MINIKAVFVCLIISLLSVKALLAQDQHLQQGILINKSTGFKIGPTDVLNKRTNLHALSNMYGVFSIQAQIGDTIQFDNVNYERQKIILIDYADKVVYLNPKTEFPEIKIVAPSLNTDIIEAQLGYRKKGVFYTGTPHYYYLFLKPMIFIYENFKSEVIEARKFKKIAQKETINNEIHKRWNDIFIKTIIPIADADLENFKIKYSPSLKQIRTMSEYDMINYIKKSYKSFKK